MRINRTFSKMLVSEEGKKLVAIVYEKQAELRGVAMAGKPPVQILAEDTIRLWPEIAKPRPEEKETPDARRRRDRLRQFVGAVVGMVMDENNWEVDRQGARIPPSNAVFSVGSTFRRQSEAR
jgi:hypothetical protein